jgi:hypothetical protein
MTAADLVADLAGRGVTLEADGDRLRYYPADRVGGADLFALHQQKAEVLALLPQLRVDALERDGTATLWCTLYEALTDAERERLNGEVAEGDSLAVKVWVVVARLAP